MKARLLIISSTVIIPALLPRLYIFTPRSEEKKIGLEESALLCTITRQR